MALPHLLLLLSLHCSLFVALVSGWKTLQGSPPVVIARGGFSGLFPDSSLLSYNLALKTISPNVTLWCDLQLTKDGVGICFPDIKLDNATDIIAVYPDKAKDYLINKVPIRGWFSVDYSFNELANVSLVQGVFSRTPSFDGRKSHILRVENVAKLVKSPSTGLWLNVQHDRFYKHHNLSVEKFLHSLSTKQVSISYISSPNADFLRRVRSNSGLKKPVTIFRFLELHEIEPTTNKTYGALLKNLEFIRTFASGILVPKGYIWPVDSELYLHKHTSLVSDAHKQGLKVFVSDIVNDVTFSYNFSYDPLAECLSFIDNGDFSVDGILSDFPVTPSVAINCFPGVRRNSKKQVDTLIISKYGASGDYPACTDLAYKKAKSDGADVIDCPVQISKDGIPFCLSSIDLSTTTNVAQTKFRTRKTIIPEIQKGSGIYTFSLTWNEIKTLTPSILKPYEKYLLFRNPKFKNQGKFVTLSEFLSLAKGSGVLINIENAAYLASKRGLSVTKAVLNALQKAGYDKPRSPKVMIQSTHSSVLKVFKDKSKYERVYKVDENIHDADDKAIEDIKTFADSVVVKKASVFTQNAAFLVNSTTTVARFHSFKLPVYVETFSNEFVSQAWDYYSDAFFEINSFVIGVKVNGIITDFPKTAARYTRNRCLRHGKKAPYVNPIEPGKLLRQISKSSHLTPSPPLPVLHDSNVTEPHLPSVSGTFPIFGAAR
ncbi:hypothetical protein RYX36_016408 [Vicia faba]